MNPINGSYQWLHKKDAPSVHKMVDDYDTERRNGYSVFDDFHDLNEPPQTTVLTEPYTATENKESEPWTCEICGKVCGSRLGLAAHLRTHKDA